MWPHEYQKSLSEIIFLQQNYWSACFYADSRLCHNSLLNFTDLSWKGHLRDQITPVAFTVENWSRLPVSDDRFVCVCVCVQRILEERYLPECIHSWYIRPGLGMMLCNDMLNSRSPLLSWIAPWMFKALFKQFYYRSCNWSMMRSSGKIIYDHRVPVLLNMLCSVR